MIRITTCLLSRFGASLFMVRRSMCLDLYLRLRVLGSLICLGVRRLLEVRVRL